MQDVFTLRAGTNTSVDVLDVEWSHTRVLFRGVMKIFLKSQWGLMESGGCKSPCRPSIDYGVCGEFHMTQ